MRKIPFLLLVLLQTALLVLFPQCDSLDHGIDEFRIFREDAIFQINNSSQAISAGIGDLNSTLENLNQNLPLQLQKTLSFDVPFVIRAVSGEAVGIGLCFADAAASKALYLLELMKSELITGEKVPLPDPFICHTSIGAINMNETRDHRDVPYFTGYNLFMDRKFTASLKSASGDSLPVTLGRSTNYRIEADLSEITDQTLENFNYLSLEYDGQPLSSLFVVKKHAQPPVLKELKNERPVNLAVYPAYVNNGDVHFRDDVKVSTSVTFGNNSEKAWVEMTVIMEELDGGGSNPKTYLVAKSVRNNYFSAPPGWHIKRLTGQNCYMYDSFLDLSNEEDIRYTLFGELKIKARNTVVGSTSSVVLNFSNDVPTIILESD